MYLIVPSPHPERETHIKDTAPLTTSEGPTVTVPPTPVAVPLFPISAPICAVAPDSPTWLTQFREMRFKVVEVSDLNTICEVLDLKAADGYAEIITKWAGYKIVPISTLRGILPAKNGDTVRPIRGEHRGILYRVCRYGELRCLLHEIGKLSRTKKLELATLDLVQVYPAQQHSWPRII